MNALPSDQAKKTASVLLGLLFLFFAYPAQAASTVTYERTAAAMAQGAPADSTTYYAVRTSTFYTTTEPIQRTRNYVDHATTITAAYVNFGNEGGTQGSSETFSAYVRVNGATDNLISSSCVWNATAGTFVTCSNTGLSISLSAGDTWVIKVVSPAWATNPTQAWSGYEVAFSETISGVPSLPSDANGYLKNDGAGSLTWDNASTIKTFLSLSNVENTALSSWAGSSDITTLGTITTGAWNGTDITDTYLDLTAWTGSTSITTLGTIVTGEWTGTIIDSAYLDISGSGSLPGDAEGFLFNDGAGALSWAAASAGDTIVEDESMDVLTVLLYFGALALFAVTMFYRKK